MHAEVVIPQEMRNSIVTALASVPEIMDPTLQVHLSNLNPSPFLVT